MHAIILDVCLKNGLQVCVWRDVDSAQYEVEVVEEKNSNQSEREVFKEAKDVLNYLAILKTV